MRISSIRETTLFEGKGQFLDSTIYPASGNGARPGKALSTSYASSTAADRRLTEGTYWGWHNLYGGATFTSVILRRRQLTAPRDRAVCWLRTSPHPRAHRTLDLSAVLPTSRREWWFAYREFSGIFTRWLTHVCDTICLCDKKPAPVFCGCDFFKVIILCTNKDIWSRVGGWESPSTTTCQLTRKPVWGE